MSLIKAVKWPIIYILLTLGFAGVTALAAFTFVAIKPYKYEFETIFFFFLFSTGIFLVLIGVLTIFQVPKGVMYTNEIVSYLTRMLKSPSERRDGIVLILIGLTFILVSLSKF